MNDKPSLHGNAFIDKDALCLLLYGDVEYPGHNIHFKAVKIHMIIRCESAFKADDDNSQLCWYPKPLYFIKYCAAGQLQNAHRNADIVAEYCQ